MTTSSSSSVRVAVRIRPLSEQEKTDVNTTIQFIPSCNNQLTIDNRSFTFDYVYPPLTDQEQVYTTSVIPLLNKFMEGYNSTILAYGQTGSGKTYSMGIGLNCNDGIVPRFIYHLFDTLQNKQRVSFQVSASFLELHNEDLVDLLCVKKRGVVDSLTIREDCHGRICWSGVLEEPVSTPHELMGLLQKGSIARTTASTDMNNTSSRSHAIFSVILKQQITMDDEEQDSDTTLVNTAVKKLVSKFHFVDLAGSERLKRTNAVGDRAKEGISINTGLLALGNVISALGDESRRVSHIPYRDSKLTRLLQDSLGGNSQTLMLACASPSHTNLQETLNTLKYANRARNIRNRVVVNQQVGESDRLKATITRLKEELRGTEDFLHAVNDEMDSLKTQVNQLTWTLSQTAQELATTKLERDSMMRNTTLDNSCQQEPLVIEYAKTIESLRIELLQLKQQQQGLVIETPSEDPKSYPLPMDNKLTAGRIKKKLSYKVGTKRSKSLRRKSISSLLSSNSNSTTASPKQIKSSTLEQDSVLYQAKQTIEQEEHFLQSARITIASPVFWDKEIANKPTPVPKLQYRRRTVDMTQPISVASDYLLENKQLLKKLYNAIESKHLVTRQLEKSEELRLDQSQQLNRKIQDLLSKKTASTTQFKRELQETRAQYEARIKKQGVETQSLRRKHMQLIRKHETLRNTTQSAIEQLNRNVDKLNHEKKKLIKRLKMESDRAREKHLESEREVTKLKRQEAQSVSIKKRLERELAQQKQASKRATEEIVALGGQMKQIAAIIKKVMAPKKNPASSLTDRNLLAKAAACANVRGYLVKQSAVKKAGGKFKVTTLQQHVYQKKRLIHRAISLHVNGQSTSKIGEELIQKRDRLMQEQKELLSERKLVLEQENIPLDATEPQYMDERIDLITVKVDTLNQQINRLAFKPAASDDNDDEWMDMVDKELQIGILDNTDAQVAYEIALSLVRSLEPEESRLVAEALMEDIIQLKSDQLVHTTSINHLNAMLNSLQLGVVQMRRVHHKDDDDDDDEEEEIFTPSSSADNFNRQHYISAASTKSASLLDSVFVRMLQSPVDIKCGLVLPKN